MIIIQKINVTWGKESRGVPGAVLRNAVPKSLPINSAAYPFVFEDNDFLPWHFNIPRVRYEGFKPKLTSRSFTSERMPDKIANLLLEFQKGDLLIGFHWDDCVGKPRRYDNKHSLYLRSGDYGRLLVNGRHSDDEQMDFHWYTQEIYNIAVLNQLIPDFFTSREPDQICDLRANLF